MERARSRRSFTPLLIQAEAALAISQLEASGLARFKDQGEMTKSLWCFQLEKPREKQQREVMFSCFVRYVLVIFIYVLLFFWEEGVFWVWLLGLCSFFSVWFLSFG